MSACVVRIFCRFVTLERRWRCYVLIFGFICSPSFFLCVHYFTLYLRLQFFFSLVVNASRWYYHHGDCKRLGLGYAERRRETVVQSRHLRIEINWIGSLKWPFINLRSHFADRMRAKCGVVTWINSVLSGRISPSSLIASQIHQLSLEMRTAAYSEIDWVFGFWIMKKQQIHNISYASICPHFVSLESGATISNNLCVTAIQPPKNQ